MAAQATQTGSGQSCAVTNEDLIAVATDSDVIELMASRLLKRLGTSEGGAIELMASRLLKRLGTSEGGAKKEEGGAS